MTTIEERAKKYGIESANLLCSDCSEQQRERQAKVYARVYSKIATEQKAIDDAERDTAVYKLLLLKLDNEKKLWLDKACKWLTDNDEKYRYKTTQELVEGLSKAMEE